MLYSSLFSKISRRQIFAGIFLLCSGSLAYAFYAQYVNGAEPCPLCIAQRVIYAACGLIAAVAWVQRPRCWGNTLYGLILLGIAGFGVSIAYHHVWLQSLPPAEWPASCGMPLEVLYKRIPLRGFLKLILSGSAECASVDWKIWGLAAPKVSLGGFSLIALASLYLVIYRPRHAKL